MSDTQHHDIIIVRRSDDEEEHHGNSTWKVAHADFMTAMMAFFLIMWLINATDDDVRKSIANYFNPVNLAESTPDRKGLHDSGRASGTSMERPEHPTNMPGKSRADVDAAEGDKEPSGATSAQLRGDREKAIFQDPYAVLAKLAAEGGEAVGPASADVMVGETGLPGVAGGEVFRDPFDPIYWQMAPSTKLKTEQPGTPGTADPMPDSGAPDVRAPLPPALDGVPGGATAAAAAEAGAQVAAAVPLSPPAAEGGATTNAAAAATALEKELAAAIAQTMGAAPSPHLDVRATSEGVLVSLTDDIDFSMFAIGSAVPDPKVVRAMEKIAKALIDRPGDIIVRGYTDGRPFRSDTYDNWRLSTARAHIASYMLTRGGLADSRIRKIEGYADRNLKNPADPNAAENRRIEILLREPTA
jgi:chemotaxis protein MotB